MELGVFAQILYSKNASASPVHQISLNNEIGGKSDQEGTMSGKDLNAYMEPKSGI